MEKIPCPTRMGNIRLVRSLDQLLCVLWLSGTVPQITRIHSCPKPVAFTKWLAEAKTRLCCALEGQSEASICCHNLFATKIALGIENTSRKEGRNGGRPFGKWLIRWRLCATTGPSWCLRPSLNNSASSYHRGCGVCVLFIGG